MSELHFLRPLWLSAIPVLALAWWWGVRHGPSSQWERYIPKHKLSYLLVGERRTPHGWQVLLLGWLLALIALAGPSWQRVPVPAQRNQQAIVIVLDLSPSMVATDLAPDRVTLARFKIIDLLRARGDGLTALIAYAGDAHTVVPLTDDVRTIETLLPALHPDLMPVPGSNTEGAVALAADLLDGLGQRAGHIVLVTDGIAVAVRPTLRKVLDSRYQLSVLAVGTEAGAPIPEPGGGFARDGRDDIVLARVDHEELRRLAAQHGGRYAEMSSDDADVRHLLGALDAVRANDVAGTRDKEARRVDAWQDGGYWLVLLLMPLAALGFRRGLIFAFLLACGAPPLVRAQTDPVVAESTRNFRWANLWLRPDQQGVRALAQGDPATAARSFATPGWAGYAHYRNQDYAAAAERFGAADGAIERFNLGNTLALQGKLPEAIDAYQAVIDQVPENESLGADARYNKELVARLLRDQEQKVEQNQNQEQSGGGGEQQEPRDDGQQAEDLPDEMAGQSGQPDDSGEFADNGQRAADQAERDQPQAEEGQQDTAQNDAQPAAEQPMQHTDSTQNPGDEAVAARTSDTSMKDSSEQWLRAIPDDPGGLMRRKFAYETEQYRRQRRITPSAEDRY